MAYWYRRQLSQTLMVWKKPEMVIVTITFSVAALILFIVGISSMFTYYDLNILESSETQWADKGKFQQVGIICGLLMAALVFTYMAIRMLLVRVITNKGIVVNDRLLRIPDIRNVIEWYEITDYYLVSDYPNIVFTLIVQKQPLTFERMSVRVPVYMREKFEDLLEKKMSNAAAFEEEADISTHRFSEN
ncbi:MAG: hypothetical protein AAFR61_14685 [Bacteroidota bacterium]